MQFSSSFLGIIQLFSGWGHWVFPPFLAGIRTCSRVPALGQNYSCRNKFPCAVPVLQGTFLPWMKLSILLFEGQGTCSHFIFTMKKEDFQRLLLNYTVVTSRELVFAITEKPHKPSIPQTLWNKANTPKFIKTQCFACAKETLYF